MISSGWLARGANVQRAGGLSLGAVCGLFVLVPDLAFVARRCETMSALPKK